MISHEGSVLKRDFLLKQVWGKSATYQGRTINVAINRLKEKIDPNKSKEYIKTIRGSEGVSHVAPPYDKVPNLMIDLFEWLKESDEHPLIKSCVFHYEFEFIHPFLDGNGQIGRLWQSVILYNWEEVFNTIPTEKSSVKSSVKTDDKILEQLKSR